MHSLWDGFTLPDNILGSKPFLGQGIQLWLKNNALITTSTLIVWELYPFSGANPPKILVTKV